MKIQTITSIATIMAATTLLTTSVVAQTNNQTPAQRLEKGVFLKNTKKDVDAAIEEFLSVLEDENKAKELGAEARFHLMQCYLTQGDKNAATKQFTTLKKDYPANNRWVKNAIKVMHKTIQLVAAPWKSGELLNYDIKIPNGNVMGQFLIAIEKKSHNGKQVWASYCMRMAGSSMTGYSTSVFDLETYRPISAYGAAPNFEDQSLTFPGEGGAIISNGITGKELWRVDPKEANKPQTPLYENDQVIQLMRTIPHQIGTEYQTTLVSSFSNSSFPFNIKVVGNEEITTRAGKFGCVKIETSINQTFWISTDANRYIVRINVGQADIDLRKISTWSPSTSETVKLPQLHASVTTPGGWLYAIKNNNKKLCRMALVTTDFVVKHGTLEIEPITNLAPDERRSSQALADATIEKMKAKMTDFSIIEKSKSTGNIANTGYVAFATTGTQGKLKIHTYHVYAVGQKGALSLRLYHNGKNLEATKARAASLIKETTIE